mmetsp:Transcript_13649/g.15896  ORF Transcript_13649/g.15896 Transcript_13649/m.15896 type:complete len:434 (-) Transcript_13649:208-1509(-)
MLSSYLSFTKSKVSTLMYELYTIREVVRQHDITLNEETEKEGEGKKKLVAFDSPELLCLTKDGGPLDEFQSRALKYPISYTNLLEFLKKNRQFFKQKPGKATYLFNSECEGKLPYNYPPLSIEMNLTEIHDDAEVWEFDDRFHGKDLIYAIIVNRTRKRVNLSFRGTASANDLMMDIKFLFKRIECITKFAGKDVKVHKGFSEYLFSNNSKVGQKSKSKYECICENLNTIYSTRDEQGNEIYRDFELTTTGHSLGGALAQLFAYTFAGSKELTDLNQSTQGPEHILIPKPITVITFASPTIGKKHYVKSFQKLERDGELRHLRVSNCGDIIPGFGKHCGVSIHLYEVKKAKIKYGNSVIIIRRLMRSCRKPAKLLINHNLQTYLDRISLDDNSYLLHMSIEDFYEVSHANAVFKRQTMRQNMIRKFARRTFLG